jgi:hypothetical protein
MRLGHVDSRQKGGMCLHIFVCRPQFATNQQKLRLLQAFAAQLLLFARWKQSCPPMLTRRIHWAFPPDQQLLTTLHNSCFLCLTPHLHAIFSHHIADYAMIEPIFCEHTGNFRCRIADLITSWRTDPKAFAKSIAVTPWSP